MYKFSKRWGARAPCAPLAPTFMNATIVYSYVQKPFPCAFLDCFKWEINSCSGDLEWSGFKQFEHPKSSKSPNYSAPDP